MVQTLYRAQGSHSAAYALPLVPTLHYLHSTYPGSGLGTGVWNQGPGGICLCPKSQAGKTDPGRLHKCVGWACGYTAGGGGKRRRPSDLGMSRRLQPARTRPSAIGLRHRGRKRGGSRSQGAACRFLRVLPRKGRFPSHSYHTRGTSSMASQAAGDMPGGTTAWHLDDLLCFSQTLQRVRLSLRCFLPPWNDGPVCVESAQSRGQEMK